MSGINQSFTIDTVDTSNPETIDLGFKPRVMFCMGAGETVLSSTVTLQAYAGFGWQQAIGESTTTVGSGGGRSGGHVGGSNIADSVWTAQAEAPDLRVRLLEVADLNCDPDTGHAESGYTFSKSVIYFTQLIPTIALGGDNISVASGTINWPGAAGDVAVTGVGFEPQLVMFLWSKMSTYNAPFGPVRGVGNGFGAASSADADNQFCRYERTAYFSHGGSLNEFGAVCVVAGNSGFIADATLASMDTDGFTLTFSGPDTGEEDADSGRLIGWIALSDSEGGFHVGTETAKTSTGTQSYTGAGFTPDQVIVQHGNNPANDVYYGDTRAGFGIGMFDDTLQCSIVNGDLLYDGSQSARRMNASAIAFIMGSGSASSEAEYVSMDPDGFTLDWVTSDGTAAPWGWIAMKTSGGNFAGECGPTPPPEQVAAYQRMYGWRASIDDNALETVEVFTSPQGFTS